MTSLVPRFVLGALDLTDYPFMVEFGSDLGNAENVVDVMASLLADGEIETAVRRSNRTIVIPVLIAGSDLAELAAAEASLVAECDRLANTLSVTPGDDHAPATVFDTVSIQPERVYDDNFEIANMRRWRLTIRALPFGRSSTLIEDDAGSPPSSGGTLLDNCEDDTNWSTWTTGSGAALEDISVDAVIFAEGAGSIKSRMIQWTWYGSHYQGNSFDKRTGLSLDTDTGGYLSIKIRTEWADDPSDPMGLVNLWMTTATGGEVEIETFTAVGRDDLGFVQYVWPVDAGLTVTALRFTVRQRRVGDPAAPRPYTWYDAIELLPSATTDHQITKQLTVLGSARTTGSLRISAASEITALGHVLAISTATSALPAGSRPDGRQWVTQGETDNDPTLAMHGGDYYTPDTIYSDATGTPDRPIFDVPVGMFTAGAYMMVGLVKAESPPLVFGVQAQLRIGSNDVGDTSATEVSLPGLDAGWQFVIVGTIYLPPVPMQGADSDAKVRLLFKGAKMADVYMIPAWDVGGRPVADYTIADCGTGTVEPGGASSSLFLDSPSTSQPEGAAWRGPTTDRMNTQKLSRATDLKKPGIHVFPAGSLTTHVISTNAPGPTVTLSYYPASYGSATT